MVAGKYTYYGDNLAIPVTISQHEKISGTASFEKALEYTGYGKFHFLLFVLVGTAYSAVSMEITMVSFVVPSAKCDFNMSSEDAGYLTALPMLGMIFGSFFWGALADSMGRRWVLVCSLLAAGISGVASSFAQYFILFLVLRVVNGFALSGALSLCLPLLGEFQPTAYREKILCWMELFWTLGIIGTPMLAWGIIPLNMRYESPHFVYDSWNAYVIASATPCILLGLWAITFPESPKFLIENGESEKALSVLRYMYSVNTGKHPSYYPIDHLTEKNISIIGVDAMAIDKPKKTFSAFLKNSGKITVTLFQKPYRNPTLLVTFISFGLSASYYTLMMWFPELFTRFEAFETAFPGVPSSVCEVSSIFIEVQKCQEIKPSVFFNTFIVGLACIPTSLSLPLFINWLGTKFFMVFCLFVPGLMAIGMYFVTNSLQNLIVSCIFEALTSLALVTLYCAMVEIFPTKVRVMASGLTICTGRLGGLIGNLAFGYLIDYNCVVPIVACASLLGVTGILAFFLPVNKHKKELI